MTLRSLLAALPLALVLSGCGGSVTAPQPVDAVPQVSTSTLTTAADTVSSDTTSVTGGPMGSGS